MAPDPYRYFRLEGRELFVQDCYAGADPRYRLAVRIITEQAWHSLFARHMFIDSPDVAGVPVLLNPARSLFRAEDFRPKARTTFKEPAGWALRHSQAGATATPQGLAAARPAGGDLLPRLPDQHRDDR